MASNPTQQIEFPEKALFLLSEAARYKGIYGGRGSGKSWSAAQALVLLGIKSPERMLCVRETQKSIADSVHQLLSDQIARLNLGLYYRIEKARIIGLQRWGGESTYFTFGGLRNDPDAIKSMEGATKVWVEEANGVGKRSWDILIPTVRREKSEIWLTWNPELDSDETHIRFVLQPPPNSIIRKMNYLDNPWCPDTLKKEAAYLKSINPREYEHIWLGHCKSAVEGAIYEAELAQAEVEDRITRIPYDPAKPVHTFWDLGWNDETAIIMAQSVGFEFRIIDYEEGRKTTLEAFIKRLQTRPYVWGTDWLPHDAVSGQFAAGGRSIQQQMMEMGRKVQITPKLLVHDGINAARTIFPNIWFDRERCADLIQHMRHYRYAESVNGMVRREPFHDTHSNACDAFRYMAVALKAAPNPLAGPKPQRRWQTGDWN